jgi:hypothetical protein
MSAPRGKGSGRRPRHGPDDDAAARTEPTGRVPDLLRRVVGMGFSGLFLGEEVVRKALGETLPRDWVDFAAAQSERTRRELIDRMAAELGRTLDRIDVSELVGRLVQGHAIEVTARVRFVAQPEEPQQAGEEPRAGGRRHSLRIAIADEEDAER